jgi:hypothetical protein
MYKYALFVFLITLNACDVSRFTGAAFGDQEAVQDSTTVTGVIKRADNLQVLAGASVVISRHATSSDANGRFSLQVQLNNDANRNLLFPLYVRAKKFIPLITYLYLSPEPLALEINITYGAPIFIDPGITTIDNGSYLFYTTIRDNEGIEDIIRASVIFNTREARTVSLPLFQSMMIDSLTGRWESEIYNGNVYIDRSGRTPLSFIAEDRNGWIDTLQVRLSL